MISRLFLVGVVAVLGLSIPSRPESEGWFTSVRAWAIARLADWDTCTSRAGEDCLVVRPPDSSERGVTQVTRDTRTSVAFDPIPVDEDRDTGIAYELNRMAEGLDIPPTATRIAEPRQDVVPAPSSDSIEWKLAVELCRIAEGSAADGTRSSHATARSRETEAVVAIDLMFEEDPEAYEPSAEGLASTIQAESLPDAARSKFEPIEPLADLATGTAEVLNRLADGIEVRPEGTLTRSPRVRPVEPIDVPEDLETGTAYELNRASEGLGIVPPEVPELGDARPAIQGSQRAAHSEPEIHDDLGIAKAVRLTRDAAFAWMNVLTRPTPVEMTSR